MTTLWIILSTRWGLSSVQASVNVITAVLGTIGLWLFTRVWWQNGWHNAICSRTSILLHKIFFIIGLGKRWDRTTTLRQAVFASQNWGLLLQLLIVIGAGPIAKVSLKNGLTTERQQIEVLPAVKGGGYFGNLIFEEVAWNDTMQSLNSAGFPDTQLMDFLPTSIDQPWIYVPSEWDPTWTTRCTYTNETVLPDLTGSEKDDVYHPLDAFPAYRQTFDPAWLNTSSYRVSSDFMSFQDWSQDNQMRDAIFFTIISSDPEMDGRMYHNNETLNISISRLHASDFKVLFEDTSGEGGVSSWKPLGPIGNASYSRAECTITRKPFIEDPNRVPWLWTNDTSSISKAYATYYMSPFFGSAVKNRPVLKPSSQELLQFFQVYMATVNTKQGDPTRRTLSVQVQTVEYAVLLKRTGVDRGEVGLSNEKELSMTQSGEDAESGTGVQAPVQARVQHGRSKVVAE